MGSVGCHNAQIHLKDSEKIEDWEFGGNTEDYSDDKWPIKCDHCGASVPIDANRQINRKRLYNTNSGKPEPGDMYWQAWNHELLDSGNKMHCPWSNCNDPRGHLIVILPDGQEWDTDSRAINCTMPEDKIHRCWVKHGEPPNIHVDKNGNTCQAGAGSILTSKYHGFLHNGELTSC